MSFHTPQAQMTASASGSNYLTPRTPSANAATPRSSSMRNINAGNTSTPKNVRWPDEQQQWIQPSTSHASTSQVVTTTSNTPGPSTPAKPAAPSTTATSVSPAVSSAVRTVSTSIRQTAAAATSASSPLKPSASIQSSLNVARPSTRALWSRIRWNSAAWVALLMLPRLEVSERIYWSLADAVLAVFGASAEGQLTATTAWLRWACMLVFVINLFEAGIQLRFPPPPPPSANATGRRSADGRMLAGFAQPPGRVASDATPTKSASPATARPSSNVRYSQGSPLKSGLDAARRLSGGGGDRSSRRASGGGDGSILGGGRRLPSGPPSNASPLAAYLARRTSRGPSDAHGGGDDIGDVSGDSIEVDRALRALSNSYMRSSNRSRTEGGDAGGDDSFSFDRRRNRSESRLSQTPATPIYAGR